MTRTFAERAESLFLDASELEPADRGPFITTACAGDVELLREVSALLQASTSSEAFFADFSERLGVSQLLGDRPTEKGRHAGEAGLQVGPYRLTHRVGAGGMGAVWQAERSDGRFEGVVAIKLLTPNAGLALAKRFEREGQMLAKLAHPRIARLLDAGVMDSGQAYIVLEYVDGEVIDQYCDSAKLSVAHRLRLFLDVLDAVAKAHANLVIHRDIKPSNVLVNQDGEAKLLDFGVAKMMRADDADQGRNLTREFGAALTPEFAAPEQLLGEAVTTATDVYSLGMLLFVLLSGVHPRPIRHLDSLAALHAALEKAPILLSETVTVAVAASELSLRSLARQSTPENLAREFRGDLDNMLRKSMAVDVQRRYATVNEFAEDIRRYLKHKPVSAQPDTVGYRVRKFARRHRGGVVATLLTSLAVMIAAVISVVQTFEAKRQLDFALQQQQRAESTSSFMNLLFAEIGQNGRSFTISELLDRGVTMLNLRYEIDSSFTASTYYDVAQHFANVGNHNRSLELLERAESSARETGDEDLLARALCSTAQRVHRQSPEVARRKSIDGSRILLELAEASVTTRASCIRARSFVLELDEKPMAAIELLQSELSLFDGQPSWISNIKAAYLGHLASLYFKIGSPAETIEINNDVLELLRIDGRDGSAGYLITTLNQAAILQSMGELQSAHRLRAGLVRPAARRVDDQELPAYVWREYATGLNRLGRPQEALQVLLSRREDARSAGADDGVARFDLQIGISYAKLGNPIEANRWLDEAEAFFLRSPGASSRLLRGIDLARISVSLSAGDSDSASLIAEDLLVGLNNPQDRTSPIIVLALLAAGDVAMQAENAAAARTYATDAYEIARDAARDPAASAYVGQALYLRARANIALSDADGARSDLELALPPLRVGLGAAHSDAQRASKLLAGLTI